MYHYQYVEERDKAARSFNAGDCMKAEQEMFEAIKAASGEKAVLSGDKNALKDLAEGYMLLGHIYSD